jgi:hypothetical protein
LTKVIVDILEDSILNKYKTLLSQDKSSEKSSTSSSSSSSTSSSTKPSSQNKRKPSSQLTHNPLKKRKISTPNTKTSKNAPTINVESSGEDLSHHESTSEENNLSSGEKEQHGLSDRDFSNSDE